MEEEFSGFPDSSDIHEQVQLHYELAISDLESDISLLEAESSKFWACWELYLNVLHLQKYNILLLEMSSWH